MAQGRGPGSADSTAWRQLEASHWIADGRDGARVVYVFTDPNCPYCNKLWSEARPRVAAGKIQLRHVIVGILTPTRPGKADQHCSRAAGSAGGQRAVDAQAAED